jgi:hypothetical protein
VRTTVVWPDNDLGVIRDAASKLNLSYAKYMRWAASHMLQHLAGETGAADLKSLAQAHRELRSKAAF